MLFTAPAFRGCQGCNLGTDLTAHCISDRDDVSSLVTPDACRVGRFLPVGAIPVYGSTPAAQTSRATNGKNRPSRKLGAVISRTKHLSKQFAKRHTLPPSFFSVERTQRDLTCSKPTRVAAPAPSASVLRVAAMARTIGHPKNPFASPFLRSPFSIDLAAEARPRLIIALMSLVSKFVISNFGLLISIETSLSGRISA